MLRDARDVPVSTTNSLHLEVFERALTEWIGHHGDPLTTINTILAEDDSFLIGHLLRANLILTGGDWRLFPVAEASVEVAQRLARSANARELLLTAASQRWISGEWDLACRTWDALLKQYPRDVMALHMALWAGEFRGEPRYVCNLMGPVIAHWSPDLPGYASVLGMHAYSLAEHGSYRQARNVANRALCLDPQEAWAMHTALHILELQGSCCTGIACCTSQSEQWRADTGMASHSWWHVALLRLDRGDTHQALAIYDAHIVSRCDSSLQNLTDAVSLLWRLHLQAVELGERWSYLADVWQRRVQAGSTYNVIGDVHATIAFLQARRFNSAGHLFARMERAAHSQPPLRAGVVASVGLPICRSLWSFDQRRFCESLDLLLPTRAIWSRLGGSRTQLDLLDQTLLEAALRAQSFELALELAQQRVARRATSPQAWRSLARARETCGDGPGATQASLRAENLLRSGDQHAA